MVVLFDLNLRNKDLQAIAEINCAPKIIIKTKYGYYKVGLAINFQNQVVMRAGPENYKGISYIRISSLPAEQRKNIYHSINHDLVIHILRGDELLNDCLQYQHYSSWYENVFSAPKVVEASGELALAFK
jgi:hypothetical protein